MVRTKMSGSLRAWKTRSAEACNVAFPVIFTVGSFFVRGRGLMPRIGVEGCRWPASARGLALADVGSPLPGELGGSQDRLNDAVIPRAAAQVARDRLDGFLTCGRSVFRQERGDGGQEAGCTESALQAVALL